MRTIFGVRVSAGIPPQEEKGPRERARQAERFRDRALPVVEDDVAAVARHVLSNVGVTKISNIASVK